MGILMEGLINLKIIREKRAQVSVNLVSANHDIDTLIQFYDFLMIKGKKLQSMKQNDEIFVYEFNKLQEIKVEFSNSWNNLSDDKQGDLVKRMINLKLLPKILGKALEIFGGTFICII